MLAGMSLWFVLAAILFVVGVVVAAIKNEFTGSTPWFLVVICLAVLKVLYGG